jgi:anaerobic selenocysteine-containing dehydrogenase
MQEHHTICRACHAACGVIVEVEDGAPVAVRGNPDNPVYKGFCCVKGQNFGAQRNNPNRLLHSQKRQADGSYRDIPVQQAMDEIAEKLTTLRENHGSRSIALYGGTFSAAASAINGAIDTAFMKAIGSPMGFSSNTIDQPGKMVAAALFGRWMAPATNFADANVILLFGLNPLVAMSGGIPHTNPGRYLTDALANGLKLLVVDPRRSETARRATQHLQVRPGHDIPLIAAMLHVILSEGLHDADFVREHMRGVDALREAVAGFAPETVAPAAGIATDELVAAARTFATSGPGVAVAGTGPNMAGQTTLLEYLVLCLNSVCGRWQRAGDTVRDPATLGQFVQPVAQALPPYPEYAYGFGETMHARGIRNSAAGMPTGALSDEILLEDEHRVRALITHGGNPVAAWPDQLKTLQAMRSLDLLVQLDLTMSATAREADYVIAVKHPLEMAGTSLNHEYLSAYAPGYGATQAWAQYTPAVVDVPAGSDLVEDWEFFYGVAQRMGLELRMTPVSFTGTVRVRPVPLDMAQKPTTDDLLALLTEGSRVPLATVKAVDGGAVFAEPAVTVAPAQPDWEGRLDAGNARMLADLVAFEAPASADEEWPLRLVSRRQINVLNSSGHDIPGQHRGKTYNPAFLHPDDLAELGLDAGDLVTLRSARASIPAVVEVDRNLRRGLVSMSHSWGGGPDTDSDVRSGGACTGRLLTDDADYEAYTAMPRMSNIPVKLEPYA